MTPIPDNVQGAILISIIDFILSFVIISGIGIACIAVNIPGSDLALPGGIFNYANKGVSLLIVPPLIFLGVGAITDFGPMIANPMLVLLGAGAHLGIFVALILAKVLGFSLSEAGAIGIITAKIMNLFLKTKINPLIGSAGIACVPIAARVSHRVANKENPNLFLIYHAMGPNLAGVCLERRFPAASSLRSWA